MKIRLSELLRVLARCTAAFGPVEKLQRTLRHLFLRLLSIWLLGSSLLFQSAVMGAIILPNATPYTQNFDTLVNSGTSGVTPAGWVFSESGTAANRTYAAGTGSSTTGNTYSFGSSSSSDRAFGGLRTGSLIPTIGASFQNGGTTPIQSLGFGYWGEQWRLGTASRTDRLDFQYSLNATSLTNGAWTDFDTLDFLSPVIAGTGALDGNAIANRTQFNGTLTGLNLGTGADLWIRWTDLDASGSDDALAIDDFSITAGFAPAAVPEPGSFFLLALAGIFATAFRLAQMRKAKVAVTLCGTMPAFTNRRVPHRTESQRRDGQQEHAKSCS